MRKNILIGLIILIIIILEFIFSLFIKPFTSCTKKGCICDEEDREISCNSCVYSNLVYVTGIVNIVKTCLSNEVIICENSQSVGERIDIDFNSCNYKILFFQVRNF